MSLKLEDSRGTKEKNRKKTKSFCVESWRTHANSLEYIILDNREGCVVILLTNESEMLA